MFFFYSNGGIFVEVWSESQHRCREEFIPICELLEFCLKKSTTASMTMLIAGLVTTRGHSRESSQVCAILVTRILVTNSKIIGRIHYFVSIHKFTMNLYARLNYSVAKCVFIKFNRAIFFPSSIIHIHTQN